MDDAPTLPWSTLQDLTFRKVSFAQNQEDILLERALPGEGGLYVDVGANDPVFHSVTKRFYDRGWSGVNVEPHPGLWDRLREGRPRDVNLNCGLGDSEGTLTFFEVPAIHGWSTFEAEYAAHYRRQGYEVVERPVPVTTLAGVCEEHVGDRTIDFLKIDVEGFERRVLLGGDWSRWRPRVVLLEAPFYQSWEPLLLAADYRFAAFDGLNRYYVRLEDAEALLPSFAAPVCSMDLAVPYDLIRLLQHQQALNSLQVARRDLVKGARWLARRHPGASRLLKRLLRRAG